VQAKFRLTLVPFLLCVLLLVQTVPARAQGPSPSGPQAAAIFAVIMGIGAGIGFGIYYLVRIVCINCWLMRLRPAALAS